MCRIEDGNRIGKKDIRHLVTMIILSRDSGYSAESICAEVKQYMKGSKYKISDERLMKIVKECLDVFYRNGVISFKNGKFVTKGENTPLYDVAYARR